MKKFETSANVAYEKLLSLNVLFSINKKGFMIFCNQKKEEVSWSSHVDRLWLLTQPVRIVPKKQKKLFNRTSISDWSVLKRRKVYRFMIVRGAIIPLTVKPGDFLLVRKFRKQTAEAVVGNFNFPVPKIPVPTLFPPSSFDTCPSPNIKLTFTIMLDIT